jgi:hypothetical protein
MLARGSHNIIVFNSFNKFSIKLTLIQYPLYSIDAIIIEIKKKTKTKKQTKKTSHYHFDWVRGGHRYFIPCYISNFTLYKVSDCQRGLSHETFKIVEIKYMSQS